VGAFPGILQFVSTEKDGQQCGNGQDKGKIEPARFFKHVNTDGEKNQKPDEFSGDVQFKTIAKTDPDKKEIDAYCQERQDQGLCHRVFSLRFQIRCLDIGEFLLGGHQLELVFRVLTCLVEFFLFLVLKEEFVGLDVFYLPVVFFQKRFVAKLLALGLDRRGGFV